eukprot:CAMPEP_0182586194 /NCGR_PEP_ID=MMETSP1324-20130603/62023_1 /TAXON_ID=236786 /ORGANISM="Florenciella sp., Strain RCC1587" /LENGTH=43 /DNA_ID= /DNA_START= /DNA_END= /DNA_ORIENTATION=
MTASGNSLGSTFMPIASTLSRICRNRAMLVPGGMSCGVGHESP